MLDANIWMVKQRRHGLVDRLRSGLNSLKCVQRQWQKDIYEHITYLHKKFNLLHRSTQIYKNDLNARQEKSNTLENSTILAHSPLRFCRLYLQMYHI